MKLTAEKIFKSALFILSCLSCVAGEPIKRCLPAHENIERYDPSDPGTVIECVKCPDCPEGQGLSPQCGDRVTNDTKIECKPCIANITYSDSHGVESCKSCPECGLKNIIQHCTPRQKRVCGTVCPPGYFLDHNSICQECYFCCDNVSESGRRQECQKIGMDRNWQCEKTEQNQRCKEALDKATTMPTDAIGPATPPSDHSNYTMSTMKMHMTKTHLKTQVDETKGSQNSPGGSTTMGSSPGTEKRNNVPANDDSTSRALPKHPQNGQEENGSAQRVIIGVVSTIVIVSAVALLSTKRGRKFFRSLRKREANLADGTELQPLQANYEPTSSGSSTPPQDIKFINEVSAGKNVNKPNLADIPADCLISEMEKLCNNEGRLMLFYVQKKLDVPETSIRKTWRGVGLALDVDLDDLDSIEIDYKSDKSPTESLLSIFRTREKEPTMREFAQALLNCERHDIANVICNWPWEKRLLQMNMMSQLAQAIAFEVD